MKGRSHVTPRLLSPVGGDMHGFPPTILTSGARGLVLKEVVEEIALFFDKSLGK